VSAFGTGFTSGLRSAPPTERLGPIPRCPACGKRVIDDGHGVYLHGDLYHGRCALYTRRGSS
jgi:hypothetical protein